MFRSDDDSPSGRLRRQIRSRHPGLRNALGADARAALKHRGERHELEGSKDTVIQILRLCWVSDAFLGQALYRVKATLERRGVPVLPTLCHRLAIMVAGVAIDDKVIMHPGVHILHGPVVIGGVTEIHAGAVIAPFASIGLVAGDVGGPTIEEDVMVGTSASVLGKLTVGRGATIGANSVVLSDVEAGATVAGAPARPTRD
jgi:serine O-acetyltransferase